MRIFSVQSNKNPSITVLQSGTHIYEVVLVSVPLVRRNTLDWQLLFEPLYSEQNVWIIIKKWPTPLPKVCAKLCIALTHRRICSPALRFGVYLFESFINLSVREARLYNTLQDYVYQPFGESLMLTHCKYPENTCPGRLRAYHMPQLICQIEFSTKL